MGVTGSFGTGKTTVAEMLKAQGACIIDADKIYHSLIKPKNGLCQKISLAFGGGLLDKHGQLNRQKLAEKAFTSKQLIKSLCDLTHPQVIKQIKSQVARFKKNKTCKLIVIDAPLLIEAGLTAMVDKLIVVKTNRAGQITRIEKKMRLTRAQIIQRITSQLPLSEKLKLADFVIDNNGTLAQTRKQAEKIWKTIQRRQ